MSFREVAVSVLVLAGGLAAVPASAWAQVAPDPGPAATVAPVVDPAEEDVAADPGCRTEEDREQPEETLRALPASDDDVATAAAKPVAHCSQNAGDNQYKDPFFGSKPPKGGGDSQTPADGSQASDGQPATSTSVLAGQEAGVGADAAVDPGSTLPNSGLDAGPLCAAGLGLLLAGTALRRRIA